MLALKPQTNQLHFFRSDRTSYKFAIDLPSGVVVQTQSQVGRMRADQCVMPPSAFLFLPWDIPLKC